MFFLTALIPIHAFAGTRFQPRECEFSVEFPSEPKVYDILIPGIGEVQNGEYRNGTGIEDAFVLVVEGYPVSKNSPIFVDPKHFLYDGAKNYAESNGIQNAEFKYFKDVKGYGITMRGYKVIRGIPVIYSTLTLLGKNSMITLRVSSAAKIFPPPGVVSFLKSIE